MESLRRLNGADSWPDEGILERFSCCLIKGGPHFACVAPLVIRLLPGLLLAVVPRTECISLTVDGGTDCYGIYIILLINY